MANAGINLKNWRIVCLIISSALLCQLLFPKSIFAESASSISDAVSEKAPTSKHPAGEALAPAIEVTAKSEPTSAVATTPQPASTQKKMPSLGVLDLEEYIATNKFSTTPGMNERAILVRAYERIILSICFPKINYIVKGGVTPSSDERCHQYTDKLSKLHSNNTILICAQKGIDSIDCARSFETQHVRKFKSEEISKLTLTGKISKPDDTPEKEKNFSKLQKALMDEIKKFKEQFSLTNLKSLDAAFYPVLSLICSEDGLELTEKPVARAYLSNSQNSPGGFSLADALADLNKPNEEYQPALTPTISEQASDVYYRSRLLTNSCFDTIKDALELDSRLSSAICFRDGFISPSCISSLRRISSLIETPSGTPVVATPARAKDGLDSF